MPVLCHKGVVYSYPNIFGNRKSEVTEVHVRGRHSRNETELVGGQPV